MNVAVVDGPAPKQASPHRWVALVVALALLVGGGALVQAGGTVLRQVGMVAVPQRYVALSVPNPTALPVHAKPGSSIAFTFAITNSTTQLVRQPWIVDVASSGLAGQEMAHGSAAVSPGASVTIPVGFQLPHTLSNVTVTISAPGQHLAPLEFHVTSPSGGGTP